MGNRDGRVGGARRSGRGAEICEDGVRNGW
jgi:hypothetical protein